MLRAERGMNGQDGVGHDRTGQGTIGRGMKRWERMRRDRTQWDTKGTGQNKTGQDGTNGAVIDGLSLIPL